MIGQAKNKLNNAEEKRLLETYKDVDVSMAMLQRRFGIGEAAIYNILKKTTWH